MGGGGRGGPGDGLKETFFRPFGPHFGLKIRGDPSPGSAVYDDYDASFCVSN